MKDYIEVGEILKKKYKVNLQIWIDLNFHRQSDEETPEYLKVIVNGGRVASKTAANRSCRAVTERIQSYFFLEAGSYCKHHG
jgi:hypothetical protein